MPKSAAAAYRADLAGGHDGYSERDGLWLAVTSVLEHAALVGGAEGAEMCLHARELAAGEVNGNASPQLKRVEWRGRTPAGCDFIVLLADEAYAAGALNVANAMLSALLRADESLTALESGIALTRLARVVSKMGRLDEAADRYRVVARLGRQRGIPELQVRAWIGLGAIAQMKGNYPDLRRFAQRALRLAERSGLGVLARYGHMGLMVVCGARHHYEDALVHGWAAYAASTGDAHAEAEVLQNMGQLLLEAGRVEAARAAFAAILARELPIGIVLPALGGLALAGAATEQGAVVEWSAREVERLGEMPVNRHLLAVALLECAAAMARIGRVQVAERLKARAVRIAETHGFHEITMRAESLTDMTEGGAGAGTLGDRAVEIARKLEWMEPERLPDHALVAAARH